MITGHVFMATSLDGFVARKNHQLDWLNKQDTGNEDLGYDGFISQMDGLVMGTGSFKNVLSFGEWPYKKPAIVIGHSLDQTDIPPALEDKVELTKLSPKKVMALLETKGWHKAYIDGGKVVQSFIRSGLIVDMVLTTIPILIGDGLPLFGAIDEDIDLVLKDSKAFKSGLVQNHYQIGVKSLQP